MDGHCQFNKRFNFPYNIFCYVFYRSNYSWFYNIVHGYMGLFDIYNKEHRRTIMAKETIKEMLKMIDAKIEHIEDISADNRAIIVKLVKQNNQIVQFLKSLELEIVEEEGRINEFALGSDEKLYKVMKLIEQFKESNEEFKKFMKELEENKDKLTPGQFGES